jgi:hypothetical protein
VYVTLIKQAVVKRRRSECRYSNALDDVKVLNTTDNTDLWLTDASYSGFGTDLDVITGTFYQLVLFR